jgi:hypothetical protein
MKHDQFAFSRSLDVRRKTFGIKSVPYPFGLSVSKGYYHTEIVLLYTTIVKGNYS